MALPSTNFWNPRIATALALHSFMERFLMAYFGGFDFNPGHSQDQLGRQIASLSRDAAHISDALRRFGSGAGRDASHFAHHLADGALHQGAYAAKLLGRQARKAGRAVGKDPVPAMVAVAGLACLLTLAMSGGGKSRRR